MLSSIVRENTIQLNLQASTWEDAIRKAMSPLLQSEYVTAEYVQKVIDIAKETGPYIVITKHVAIPHAPAKYGAKKLTIGISSLKSPVVFGHQANDPVKYLFCLSAPDSESHLGAMAELVTLLEDQEFFAVLDRAKNSEEVIAYIAKKESRD